MQNTELILLKHPIIKGSMALGPMEEDINTMHRYRDALVVEQEGLLSEQPTERTYYSRGTKRKHTRNIHFIKVSKK